jgi:putative ABC transport system substrate-binding protein
VNAAEALRPVTGTPDGLQTDVGNVRRENELEAAFESLRRQGADALILLPDPKFQSRRNHIIALAARHALPAIYFGREFVTAGGLLSYSASLADAYRVAGGYASRILKGEKPAELPVVQPTKFEFVINLRTARALGVEVPPALLARADEAIE